MNLVAAVSSIEDRLHFGSTAASDEQSPEDMSPQVIDKMDAVSYTHLTLPTKA